MQWIKMKPWKEKTLQDKFWVELNAQKQTKTKSPKQLRTPGLKVETK